MISEKRRALRSSSTSREGEGTAREAQWGSPGRRRLDSRLPLQSAAKQAVLERLRTRGCGTRGRRRARRPPRRQAVRPVGFSVAKGTHDDAPIIATVGRARATSKHASSAELGRQPSGDRTASPGHLAVGRCSKSVSDASADQIASVL
ncbi:hypothetical protein MRX96_016115 [Rhipicephalus microplus]